MNITATQLKQDSHLLSHVKEEDIVITKRSKPFAVIVDYEKYNALTKEIQKAKIQEKLDALESLQSFPLGGKDYKQIKGEADL